MIRFRIVYNQSKTMKKNHEVQLKPVDFENRDHLEWLYKIRTHPDVARHFFAPPPSDYDTHVKFIDSSIKAKSRSFFIVSLNSQMTGYCQIIFHPDSIEVGFALHPDWWGMGIGSQAVHLLLNHLLNQEDREQRPITLVVKEDNLKAISLYKKCNFVITEKNGNKLTMTLRNC